MKYQINLFPKREQNFADKLIYFSFHYLRYILVITQLVVIGVFFYRFKVDQDIVDLKDSLQQKQEIITVSKPLLTQASDISFKLSNITSVMDDQYVLSSLFTYLFSIFPEKLTLTSLNINQAQVEMVGVTTEPDTVKIFYNRLKKDKKFKVITLRNIEKKEDGFEFSFILDKYTP